MSEIIDVGRLIEQRNALERRLIQVHKIEAIGQLAGGIAKDLRDLLTIVFAQLDQVQRRLSEEPGASQEYDDFERVADHTLSLARGLLGLLEGLALRPAIFDASKAIDNLLELLGDSLGTSTRIYVVHNMRLWDCEADPTQLQNALLNLLVNARDAMPRGGRITISTRNEHLETQMLNAGPTDYVVLSVSDTGIGMTREVRERACEPFFTTKPPGKGSGLGLSMVRGFVARSKGFMVIESDVGRGTSVHLYLPRGIAHANAAREPIQYIRNR